MFKNILDKKELDLIKIYGSVKKSIKKALSKLRPQEFAAIVAVFSLIFINIFSFAARCSNIRGEVLRLHVIANSDSKEDQELKLLVRDEVLKAGAEVFDGSIRADEAIEKISPQINKLEEAAKKVILANDQDYGVDISIDKEYFDTRAYGDLTLPAGKYMAIKVKLGQSAGENWWCVMFPPLCLPAASDKVESDDLHLIFDDENYKIVKAYPKYEYRFKIVEVYERFTNSLFNRQKVKIK